MDRCLAFSNEKWTPEEFESVLAAAMSIPEDGTPTVIHDDELLAYPHLFHLRTPLGMVPMDQVLQQRLVFDRSREGFSIFDSSSSSALRSSGSPEGLLSVGQRAASSNQALHPVGAPLTHSRSDSRKVRNAKKQANRRRKQNEHLPSLAEGASSSGEAS